MDRDDLLVIRGLRKYFAADKGFLGKTTSYVKAVDGVNLVIKKGETLGLVGESGCGKTTLGRCILRLEEPTAGEIFFEGKNILSYHPKDMQRLRRDMQIIFQDPYSSLNPRWTVAQTLAEPFAIHGLIPKRDREAKIRELIDIVGLLPEHLDRYPHEFSGGQRQRICVARSLALNPKLIVADEPVSALDVSIRSQIINLFVKLQRQFGLTYVFISHDLSVVRHVSDRVAVMYLGRVIELADRDSPYRHPLHPYTEALISVVPEVNRTSKKRIILEGDVPSPINPPLGCNFHPRCGYRQDICRQEVPKMEELEKDHWVACFFPRNSGNSG